jgi:hypothetical protein
MMTPLKRKNRSERKRNGDLRHHEVDNNDISSKTGTPMVVYSDESSSEMISFLEFRLSTIHLYPPLNWLGPGVMAVYWFKEYLKDAPFAWVQRPKQNPLSNDDSFGRRDKKRRKLQNNSKGNFYFIPGLYLQTTEEMNDTVVTAKDIAIQKVLDFGTPDVHYATSYIGVYNLLRTYGKFAAKTEPDTFQENFKAGPRQKSSKLHRVAGGKPKVVLVHYNGPPLPQ